MRTCTFTRAALTSAWMPSPLEPDGFGVSASRVHVGVSISLVDLLNEFLEQARLWARDGIREQHHNVLRAYQAATRLAVNNHDVYPGWVIATCLVCVLLMRTV